MRRVGSERRAGQEHGERAGGNPAGRGAGGHWKRQSQNRGQREPQGGMWVECSHVPRRKRSGGRTKPDPPLRVFGSETQLLENRDAYLLREAAGLDPGVVVTRG